MKPKGKHIRLAQIEVEILAKPTHFEMQADGVHIRPQYSRDPRAVSFEKIFCAAYSSRENLKNPVAVEIDVVRADLEVIIAAAESGTLNDGMVADALTQLKKATKLIKP